MPGYVMARYFSHAMLAMRADRVSVMYTLSETDIYIQPEHDTRVRKERESLTFRLGALNSYYYHSLTTTCRYGRLQIVQR